MYSHVLDNLARTVGGVVVHDNDVELELRLLSQCALHSVAYGFLTVFHRNDHRCLNVKVLLVEVWCLVA